MRSMLGHNAHALHCISILAVVVIYNLKLEESSTMRSLLETGMIAVEDSKSFQLIVYDNSQEEQSISKAMPFSFSYIHDAHNGGLAAAYNYALRVALKNNVKWLLLLDQDSVLPPDYLSSLRRIDPSIVSDESVVAIVPQVRCSGKLLSPSRLTFDGRTKALGKNCIGLCDAKMVAINSGILLRTSFIAELEGFSSLFWLDYLDYWLFHMIYTMDKKVYVTDSVVEHEMSTVDYNKYMTEDRYRNILESETIFHKEYKTRSDNALYSCRLLFRTLKQLCRVKNKRISYLTFRQFCKRVISLRSIICSFII
jgi:GT2 family glycosyltransferase